MDVKVSRLYVPLKVRRQHEQERRQKRQAARWEERQEEDPSDEESVEDVVDAQGQHEQIKKRLTMTSSSSLVRWSYLIVHFVARAARHLTGTLFRQFHLWLVQRVATILPSSTVCRRRDRQWF